MSSSAKRGFVCVVNGNRDAYQVPLGLAEAGLLARFVTDFYAPDGGWGRLLPGFLRRRRVDGLDRIRTTSAWASFVVQAGARMLRVSGYRMFAFTDALLAWTGGRVARRIRAPLYCYHSYIPRRVDSNRVLVVFAYHPRPATELALIEADALAFPEVAPMLERERAYLAREPTVDWRSVDGVVCASGFTKASLIADGCAAEKITVIPYGSPFESDAKPQPRAVGAPAEFLFVGQGIQRKGLHHLIRAWQAQPPADARLTIVSYRIEPEIAALIANPSIRLLGYQPREALTKLFARSDVFVMPSLIEGFGLAYGEALAQGCHVIGTPNTGLPEMKLDADAATLVAAGDVDGLSSAIVAAAERARRGGYDRASIAAQSGRWTRPDFRRAIGEHAAQVLRDRGTEAA